jgi:hypothetical protein
MTDDMINLGCKVCAGEDPYCEHCNLVYFDPIQIVPKRRPKDVWEAVRKREGD